jgi:hypothetical protein
MMHATRIRTLVAAAASALISDRDKQRHDRTGIFSVRPDGTQLQVLIDRPANDFDPDYSPNGR